MSEPQPVQRSAGVGVGLIRKGMGGGSPGRMQKVPVRAPGGPPKSSGPFGGSGLFPVGAGGCLFKAAGLTSV